MSDPETGATVEPIVAAVYPERTPTAVEPLTPGSRRRTAVVRFRAESPVVVRVAPDG